MSGEPTPSPPTPPPRAFTQGVGTVFQFTGVMVFLAFFFACCLSGLLSKETATHSSLGSVGWGGYSAQRALSICMVIGVLLGIGLAGAGLGLQAMRRNSPAFGVVVAGVGTGFWLFHTVFFAFTAHSILLTLIALALAIGFGTLLALAIGAVNEMRRNPPPVGMEILPPDYKVPYSHQHQDPPEVRLAKELEQRRERLAVQQKELEMLEQKLHRKLKDGGQ
jgi:hypothetical protein